MKFLVVKGYIDNVKILINPKYISLVATENGDENQPNIKSLIEIINRDDAIGCIETVDEIEKQLNDIVKNEDAMDNRSDVMMKVTLTESMKQWIAFKSGFWNNKQFYKEMEIALSIKFPNITFDISEDK